MFDNTYLSYFLSRSRKRKACSYFGVYLRYLILDTKFEIRFVSIIIVSYLENWEET